jgi:diaminohydroxyphosphoribosylaminopyrimidine deaminase / 5-amino-6-(5-phosphoribosylamino)uracil reductase
VGFKNQLTPEELMDLAISQAATARRWTSPNPWVGCAIQTASGAVHLGATEPPGQRHAEIVARDRAIAAEGPGSLQGAIVAATLEPCSHTGRTGPCADALLAEGVGSVHIGVVDPDPNVGGDGVARLRGHGVVVTVGTRAESIEEQLAPYLHHRLTGLPWVVAKMAATLDGRTAAADGTSKWITSAEARTDAHRIRAESDAIIVGAGTVRSDDPSLNVRLVEGRDPRRIVLGHPPAGAKVHPCEEYSGDLEPLLRRLAREGVVQVMIEGGAHTLHAFHRAGLVDRYVIYFAPALMGGEDGLALMSGPGAATINDLWRGKLLRPQMIGGDLRIELGRAGS